MTRSNKFSLIGTLPFLLLLILFATPAWTLDPAKKLSQFGHTTWRLQDGFFNGTPTAVVQTMDGYLWLGTESGLWRFDGVRFVRWNPPTEKPQLELPIESLLASHDGSLWIGTTHGLFHWKGQELTLYPEVRGFVSAILERANGEIWFTDYGSFSASAVCQVVIDQVRCYGKEDEFSGPTTLAEGIEGNLWIGTNEGLVCWKPGLPTFYGPVGLKGNKSVGVSAIVPAQGNSLWVGMAVAGRGLGLQQLIRNSWKTFITPQLDGSTLQVTALLLDRQNSLWVGTETQGIYRIRGRQVDHFRRSDGLSSDTVFQSGLFEDREGNIWVTTSLGLDCFRDLRVTTFTSREGLTVDEVDAVLASRDGTVWVGGPRALDAISPDNGFSVKPQRNLPGSQVTALLEDHRGQLWVGIDNDLFVNKEGNFHRVVRERNRPVGFVVGMTEDVDHNVWAETRGTPRELLRIQGLRVVEEFPAPQMPTARTLAADPGGGIWLGLGSGDLARYVHGRLEVFSFKQSTAPNIESVVNHLAVNTDGSVMGATSFGLIAWKNGQKQTLTTRNGLPCNWIHAFLTDNQGNLWLYAQCGLVRVANSELQKWWDQPDAVLQVKVWDAIDGAQPGHAPFNAAAKSKDGRLWFTNNISLQMVDPARMEQNSIIPPVHIEEVIANHQRYAASGDISLPPSVRDIEIAYTALSFTAPQKVHFRYRLDGYDQGWLEAGTRRQAFYNDLPPGRYRFRVVASNNEGLWNEAGASLDFRIPPAWYQTIWFHGLSGITIILVLGLIHRLRMRQVARAISIKSDARLAERTRMARELHDTFIQTIQGSRLVVNDALARPSDSESMLQVLRQLADWLERATQEARTALNSLRESTTGRNDLRLAFQHIIESNFIPGSMSVNLSVIGEIRAMHPIVRHEIYRIAHEAIRNASQHSHASRLDIELRYGRELTLRVGDNGIGIDPAVLDKGKKGHFGLQGMRERAGRIGAKLTLLSNTSSGTVITLVVPEGVLYSTPRTNLFVKVTQNIKRFFARGSD